MAHWDDENFSSVVPSNEILCTNCKFRMSDVDVDGRLINRAGYGSCSKYTLKPQDVLWNGAYCPQYRKE